MNKEIIEAMESGRFYSKFNKSISSIDDGSILCKWQGNYACEIQKFEIYKSIIDNKYHLTLEMYSDWGLGPRVYVKEEEIEGFLQGKPCTDGSYLYGKGITNFLKELVNG